MDNVLLSLSFLLTGTNIHKHMHAHIFSETGRAIYTPAGSCNASQTYSRRPAAAVRDRKILKMVLLMDQETNGALTGIATSQECARRR